MDRLLRLTATAATLSFAVLVALPAAVAACTGPACGAEQPVEGAQTILLVAILAVFGTIMAVAEARRR
jgi:hypothetical protein